MILLSHSANIAFLIPPREGIDHLAIESMAEPILAASITTVFPNPPSFWESFTTENLDRIKELQRAKAESSETSSGSHEPSQEVPLELRVLQPPLPPVDGKYRCFGDSYNVIKMTTHIFCY